MYHIYCITHRHFHIQGKQFETEIRYTPNNNRNKICNEWLDWWQFTTLLAEQYSNKCIVMSTTTQTGFIKSFLPQSQQPNLLQQLLQFFTNFMINTIRQLPPPVKQSTTLNIMVPKWDLNAFHQNYTLHTTRRIRNLHHLYIHLQTK